MPGTVPRLVNCQNVQLAQPLGIGGLPLTYPATHNGSEPNAMLLPVHACHQSAVVYMIGSCPVSRLTSPVNADSQETIRAADRP